MSWHQLSCLLLNEGATDRTQVIVSDSAHFTSGANVPPVTSFPGTTRCCHSVHPLSLSCNFLLYSLLSLSLSLAIFIQPYFCLKWFVLRCRHSLVMSWPMFPFHVEVRAREQGTPDPGENPGAVCRGQCIHSFTVDEDGISATSSRCVFHFVFCPCTWAWLPLLCSYQAEYMVVQPGNVVRPWL